MDGRVATSRWWLMAALLLGAGVSVALGVYGRVHVPTYTSLPSWGFSSTSTFKAWMGTVVVALAGTPAGNGAVALRTPARRGAGHRRTWPWCIAPPGSWPSPRRCR